jgi:hypothetical protein
MKINMISWGFATLLLIIAVISCNMKDNEISFNNKMNAIAEEYVKLVFNVGKYDADYVDAYFGPERLKKEADSMKLSLIQVKVKADSLITLINSIDLNSKDELLNLRYQYLKRMLSALKSKLALLSGEKMSFDEESKALYDAIAPAKPLEYYDKLLNELDSVIPGKGDLIERYSKFREQFIIPSEKLDTVFKKAILEARRRTLQHIKLPEKENFLVEYVKDKPWGGYNWFKGNSYSLIQINTDLPNYIDRAIGLACHEGYPGHHVYHSMLEKNFVNGRGWVEFSIYPLFSPQSMISEGLANYGIEVVFPKKEKIKFEKEVLFPLAALNPENTELYYHILDLLGKLDNISIDVARQYLDGKITREEGIQRIMKYRIRKREYAEINMKFFEKYRAYIITYSLGEDLVKEYIEIQIVKENETENKWKKFIELLNKPILPAYLKIN